VLLFRKAQIPLNRFAFFARTSKPISNSLGYSNGVNDQCRYLWLADDTTSSDTSTSGSWIAKITRH